MRRLTTAAALAAILMSAPSAQAPAGPEWKMKATVIEACSCTMFCPCYFNAKPEGHHTGHEMKHFCRANNAYKVVSGYYGATILDGAKFWIATDLGGDFSKGQMDWAVLIFDKAMTKEQRDAIGTIAGRLFPVKWNSLTTAEGDISWVAEGGNAHALLDGGKSGEVKLASTVSSNKAGEPVVIKNLKYWGATTNEGFVLMPNVVEAYRVGPKAFEYKGTNGFMLTLEIDSKTAPPPASAGY